MVQELTELASVLPALVPQDLSDAESDKLIAQIVMLPFFRSSPITRKIEFTHEIIAELLAARCFLRELRTGDPRFAARISTTQWPADSVFFTILAPNELSSTLGKLYTDGSLRPVARRNLVQLIVRSHSQDTKFDDSGVTLEGVGLQGVAFERLNLNDMSFRSCDLTNALFRNCSLQSTRFEGAVLKNTRFSGTGDYMSGASFGNCEHFESVIVDGRQRLTDDAAFERWVTKATGVSAVESSCATRRQLHHVFRKFVHLNGQARRDELDRRGVERGKHYSGAPDSGECVDRLLRTGYLEEERRLKRIRRPQGLLYGEIVDFVVRGELSSGLRSLLSVLCSKPGCQHT